MSSYDTEDPVEINKKIAYVVDVRNEGTSNVTDIQLENIVPLRLKFISAEGPTTYTIHQGRKVIFQPVSKLFPGDKLVYKIYCQAVKSGETRNFAIVKYHPFKKFVIDAEMTMVVSTSK